jgi:PAS domain S-box-containing protein
LDIKEVLSGKQTRGFENEVFSGDGNKRLFIWNADRLLDFNGNPIGIIAVGHDITERKQAEDNATRLGHILESSLNEIYLFNAETLQFIQVNRGARDNLGYSMDELLELTPLDLKPEFTHESFAELVEPLRTGRKEVVQFNTVHKRKDKTLYPVEVHLQLTTHGFFSAFVAVILDISERKIAEQKREKLLNELQETLAHVKTLSGLLPICAHCKKIRDDGGYWNQIEKYIKDHSEVDFSHSICPECMKKHFDIEV